MTKWTKAEVEVLTQLYGQLYAPALVEKLAGRTPDQIRAKATQLGLTKKRLPERERFESFINKDGDCWEWMGSKFRDGYGQFHAANRNRRAHRYSYELYVGPIPADLCVCHRCDNPSCVDPEHLFLGTNQENATDRQMKGRTSRPYGLWHGSAKLTPEKVQEIRSSRKTGAQLAREFSVSEALICNVRKGRAWPHITAPKDAT